jgi:hypothetical protein
MKAPTRKPDHSFTKDTVYRHSRREALWILVIWAFFAAWVLGITAWLGYGTEQDTPLKTVFGFPSWVFWGIAMPWMAANVVIILFASGYMKDDPLSDETRSTEHLNQDPHA